ncbi:MAG: cytochrome c nitrite reductase small subunit [Actinomycetia bacterium]|nr:cytochrome c nitrite reductase small subunit [Actinomycetes bacterium]
MASRAAQGLLQKLAALFPVVVAALIGVTIGIGAFTFVYAGGPSYFGNDPATCNQCHAMNEQYDSWSKGSHKAVAGCNDCHAPHDSVVAKYYTKAENGFWHSLKFTTGDYPENIKIRESNRKVTEQACLHCHQQFVSDLNQTRPHDQQVGCIKCHDQVGHKR